jgi:hypothetical protein
MSLDMNPDNNRDTFQGRGVRIKELEEQVLFLTKEMIDIQSNLKDFLKTIEKSPREVTFDKEVLTLYINGIINRTLKE